MITITFSLRTSGLQQQFRDAAEHGAAVPVELLRHQLRPGARPRIWRKVSVQPELESDANFAQEALR